MPLLFADCSVIEDGHEKKRNRKVPVPLGNALYGSSIESGGPMVLAFIRRADTSDQSGERQPIDT